MIVFALLLSFVAASALTQSPGVPGGNLMIQLSALGMAALTFLTRDSRPLSLSARIPVAAILAIAVLGAFQLVPLPEVLLQSIAPTSNAIYHETNEILAQHGRPEGIRPRISIGAIQTAEAVRLILAYLALFVVASRVLSTRARRRVFVGVLLAAAILQVLVAAPLQATASRLHGVFPNPNHLAAYLELALAGAFGVLWTEVLVNRDRARGTGESAERVEKRFLPIALRILAWGILAAGIGLTQSRGGIASAIVTTLILLSIAVFHPRAEARGGRAVRGALAIACGVLLVVGIVRGVPLLRFLSSDARDLHGGLRLPIWETSVTAWKQFPVFGSGLGTFREAFRRVQPRELDSLVEKAHSDPLQLLVTGGVVGATFGVLLSASLFVLLLRRWRAQRHREESAMILAGFGALLSLTFHGLVEYTMSVPVIPAVLACVLGMAWAAGTTSSTVRSP